MSDQTSHYSFTVDTANHKSRLDKYLSDRCPDISRSRLKQLILQQQVALDDEITTDPSCKLKADQVITLDIPPAEEYRIAPENIPLDIIYEDDDLLVINKPAGMVVHPAAGNWNGTLVHALLYHCKESLSGIGGVMRPGIVHRLDKDTSGLMMVAKNDTAHQHLSAQLADRTLKRTYQAIVVGRVLPHAGVIDQPLGRSGRDRLKIAVSSLDGGKEARTHYRVLDNYRDALSLVECRLETGRTHQIRVHMEYIKFPLLGDPLYGAQPTKLNSLLKTADYSDTVRDSCRAFPRQALHAEEISFAHPRNQETMSFTTDLPEDMQNLITTLNT